MFSFYYLEFSIFFLELYKGIYNPDLKSNKCKLLNFPLTSLKVLNNINLIFYITEVKQAK